MLLCTDLLNDKIKIDKVVPHVFEFIRKLQLINKIYKINKYSTAVPLPVMGQHVCLQDDDILNIQKALFG